MNHKRDFYFSELLQSLKFVSLFIYFVGNSGRYKNPLYGNTVITQAQLKQWASTEMTCLKGQYIGIVYSSEAIYVITYCIRRNF